MKTTTVEKAYTVVSDGRTYVNLFRTNLTTNKSISSKIRKDPDFSKYGKIKISHKYTTIYLMD